MPSFLLFSRTTTCCKLDDALTASAVSRLWQTLLDNFKSSQPEVAPQIIELVESDIAEAASEELNKFFEKWRGDEFIFSLFVKYIAEFTTLGDDNCRHIINCLFQLSNLIGISGNKRNWCLLLTILIDSVRSQIAEISKIQIKPDLKIDGIDYNPINLAEYLRDNFEDGRQREFVVLFDIALYKSFKCTDIHKDVVVMTQLNEFLVATQMKMVGHFSSML